MTEHELAEARTAALQEAESLKESFSQWSRYDYASPEFAGWPEITGWLTDLCASNKQLHRFTNTEKPELNGR